jgi:DNA-binding beta-propeller fold protein YncE
VAFTPDGNDAYVTATNAGVSEISTASYTVTGTVAGYDNGPSSMVAINSHQQNS